ncbi:glycosyltransferase [Rubidibacter lacunae KORDI 51-2]|uniref:Glycosyltransferase n=1 Tax=Rubidibacter lacunae KORDI 51-2 TaxID=582515 RepID=U5DQ00_9CHRO|nr:glycosyltransferase [Rubidibacter lacunae]ERN42679.1 glycosyltransferase [Rubidibacter lacunae KORDI 51-2]
MAIVGYLINQYPKISHSFIRREILALEAQGLVVLRFAIRASADALVDPADLDEASKTRYLLAEAGLLGLLAASVRELLVRPPHWLAALYLAISLGIRSERGLVYHLAYFAEACVLRRWFAIAGVECVHAHFGTNSATVAMLCQSLGGPTFSFTVHGPEEFDKVEGIALREKLKRAAFVVSISHFGKSQLQRWCVPDCWSRIHVVRCGVDRAFLEAPERPMPTAFELVCVGRLSEQKGHFALIEAVDKVVARGWTPHIILVGDGELRPSVEAEIARRGLQGNFEMIGWASNAEVRDRILAARALVLPSFAEGLPVVLMEALALGRPAIATYIAGIPELVQPSINGWLVPAGDTEALAAAIEEVLAATPKHLTTMGLNGVQRVRQYHDCHYEAVKLARLFATCCPQRER